MSLNKEKTEIPWSESLKLDKVVGLATKEEEILKKVGNQEGPEKAALSIWDNFPVPLV